MRPFRVNWSSTTSSFSTRCLCRMASACSRVVPTGTVTRFSLVITSEIGRSKRFSNRRSRLVRMPTSLPPLVTGTPEMRNRLISSHAAEMGWSGPMVMGSTIMPLSLRLTRSTSSACRSMDMLRWTIPMPPCCASAIARWDSVTVSMAAETTGIFNEIWRVRRVRVSTSAGTTSLRAGSSRTSSKVRPSVSTS